MILRQRGVWVFPVVLTLLNFVLGAARANAQIIYPFSGNYETTIKINPIVDDLSEVVESAVSTDAPYGLDTYTGLVYSRTNVTTGDVRFNVDPTIFGLQGYPQGFITFGDGANKLFGNADAGAKIDFEKLTAKGSGVLNITGGEGIFQGATGILDFSEEDQVILGETILLKGQAKVSGSIQVPQKVPEPTTGLTLVTMGITVSLGLMLRRRLMMGTN
ncbi:hypothetical protein NIES4071_15610 [Calothrix sp. NIES-4071]|nr:hypothetical protein NIES4071_15610 [Calothrix sp. NIES-4071]BAZ55898.1 hypothetical protein NIES4105_15560 [Calothrix sp. NIES-4105]